jgi:hypothetical protein
MLLAKMDLWEAVSGAENMPMGSANATGIKKFHQEVGFSG